MTQRNDEPTGFGAYTYVVVGTGAGRDSAGVRQRLARLLAALQNLTPAEQIEAEQRLGTNVFVVPVQAGTSQQATLAYELRLAQALMSHVVRLVQGSGEVVVAAFPAAMAAPAPR